MRWGLALALVFGAAVSLSGCSDSATDPEASKRVLPAALVAVGGDGQSGVVGGDLAEPLVVRVTDKRGDPVAGVVVSWEVTMGGGWLNRKSTPTDSAGEAHVTWALPYALQPRYEVTASVGPLEPVIFSATALHERKARITLTPNSLAFDQVGLASSLTAVVRDLYDNPIDTAVVEWSSSDLEVAEVDGRGVVTSRGGGTASIIVRSDSVRALVPVSVDPGAAVGLRITGVSPDTLKPGMHATIIGTGFSADLGGNTVTIAGSTATVLAASETELQVALPASPIFGCQPSRSADVRVTVAGVTTYRSHPLRVVPRLSTLQPWEFVDLGAGADRECIELPEGGRGYLVSIYNTSTNPTAGTAFRLMGLAGDEPVPMQATSSIPAGRGALRSDLGPAHGAAFSAGPASSAGWDSPDRRARRAHVSLLEQNRDLHRRLGPPPRPAASDPRIKTAAAPQPLVEGAMLDLRVPNIDANLCSDYIPVRARVVYAGPKAVVLEDSLAPLARTMDSRYEALGREFETSMLPVLEEYFGDPFAIDSLLGNSGKVLMLFTPAVNDFGGVAGFVTNADFYPRETCASSDVAQIFYAMVPTNPSSGLGSGTADQWYRSIRSVVIHEVKHIVSFAERYARNATVMEESWLEESTAMLAEELWARHFSDASFRGSAGYRRTIYCEVRPGWPECGEHPVIMLNHFVWAYDYLRTPEAFSPLGRQGPGDGTFYGSGWLLVRWALDNFGTNEAAFVRALVQESQMSGVRNLEARTGKSFAELLGPWSLSLTGRIHFTISIRSWSLASMFSGLNQDFPDIFTEEYPLTGWNAAFGNFMVDVPGVRGGSAAYTLIGGSRAGSQVLQLQGRNGGPPASTLGMAIVRIE